jgi:hypothetical protein
MKFFFNRCGQTGEQRFPIFSRAKLKTGGDKK